MCTYGKTKGKSNENYQRPSKDTGLEAIMLERIAELGSCAASKLIIIKHRSCFILAIHQFLDELWPFSNLNFGTKSMEWTKAL